MTLHESYDEKPNRGNAASQRESVESFIDLQSREVLAASPVHWPEPIANFTRFLKNGDPPICLDDDELDDEENACESTKEDRAYIEDVRHLTPEEMALHIQLLNDEIFQLESIENREYRVASILGHLETKPPMDN